MIDPKSRYLRRAASTSPAARASGVGLVLLPVLCLASLFAGACGSLDLGITNRAELDEALKDRGIDKTFVVMPYELTPEMRQWADERVPTWLEDWDKLKHLRDRLLDPREMSLQYAWGYTGTASEVFEERRANCLAFTFLFVGMARHLGIPVYFLAVDNVETYRRRGNLVVVSDHIAVGHGEGRSRRILDFSEEAEDDPRFVRRISDLHAIAMFHSNRGAEALQRGDVDEALPWLRVAVRIAPTMPNAWVNLGVAKRRQGDFEAAEMAYKRALERDPGIYSAYQNLAALLRHQGRLEEAKAYEEGLASAANDNPYSYLTLGDISFRNGHLEDAERFYRRAVRLSRDTAEGYAALGHLALAHGDERQARRMLEQAEKRRRQDDTQEMQRVKKLRAELRDPS